MPATIRNIGPIKVPPVGPLDADVMIVGEAPGATEERDREPFVGQAGMEMTRMIQEVGLIRNACFITNVCRVRPPGNKIEKFFGGKPPKNPNGFIREGIDQLKTEILRVQPKVIVAFGNTPLWALTGNWGITKWRGSVLQYYDNGNFSCYVLPMYHPAAILRKWDWRFITVQDLKRVKKLIDGTLTWTEENFIIRPSFGAAMDFLSNLEARLEMGEVRIAGDLETRGGHIACIGLSANGKEAICIPFMCVERITGYWSEEEELALVAKLRNILTHRNCYLIGQNWPYDTQYIARWWHFLPRVSHDTMTVHHSMFSTLPKGLDFLSSLYLEDHTYWKDEGKEWNVRQMNEEQLWGYNCKDAVRTWRVAEEEDRLHTAMNWPYVNGETARDRQMSLHEPITEAMIRGVRIDLDVKAELERKCNEQIKVREQFLADVIGYPINPRSPQQLQGFFYHECNIRPLRNYKTGRPTCDEDALKTLGERYAILRPITDTINEIRSLGTFRAVAAAPISGDGRVRCQYSIPGTKTYRFSSSTDAFGDGINLQNVSEGNEHDLLKLYEGVLPPDIAYMPNMRKMMVPDPGFEIADFDLAQADAQVVAAEAEDHDLLDLFEDPDRDLHNENCELFFGPGSYTNKAKRHLAKQGVHLSNYAGKPFILAKSLGITQKEAERFQDIWFTAHPGIYDWHERTLHQLMTKRYVENRFGYRCYFFDRIEDLLKEALAWIPQSTVAIVTNLGIRAVWSSEFARRLNVQVLMQVHDSAVYQYPFAAAQDCRAFIRETMKIVVPYEHPLIIPVGCKTSIKSWGDCK